MLGWSYEGGTLTLLRHSIKPAHRVGCCENDPPLHYCSHFNQQCELALRDKECERAFWDLQCVKAFRDTKGEWYCHNVTMTSIPIGTVVFGHARDAADRATDLFIDALAFRQPVCFSLDVHPGDRRRRKPLGRGSFVVQGCATFVVTVDMHQTGTPQAHAHVVVEALDGDGDELGFESTSLDVVHLTDRDHVKDYVNFYTGKGPLLPIQHLLALTSGVHRFERLA